ncbi:Trinucleotide repeat-containing gene 18 protein [Plecturocebus cupreus]
MYAMKSSLEDMDALELDFRMRLAEVQRQYKEKQRELVKLQRRRDSDPVGPLPRPARPPGAQQPSRCAWTRRRVLRIVCPFSAPRPPPSVTAKRTGARNPIEAWHAEALAGRGNGPTPRAPCRPPAREGRAATVAESKAGPSVGRGLAQSLRGGARAPSRACLWMLGDLVSLGL